MDSVLQVYTVKGRLCGALSYRALYLGSRLGPEAGKNMYLHCVHFVHCLI